jgi:hypothetical protein
LRDEGGESFLFLMDEGLCLLVTLGDTSGGGDLLVGNLLFLDADCTELEPKEAAGYRPSLALPVWLQNEFYYQNRKG